MNTKTPPLVVDRKTLTALLDAKFPNRSEFARRVGTSPGYVHDIEHGRRIGSRHTLDRMAEVLGVDLDVIVDEVP